MKELSSSIVRLIQFVEYYLCPQYCGVVDRRRVIAYLFTTLIELIIIPFHFFLFLMIWEPSGFAMVCLHLVAFILIQYMIWKQVLRFHQGVSALFLLVAVKLVADSVLCTYFGALDDNVTVIGNIFVMLILDIAALSLMLQKTSLVITLMVIPLIAFYYHTLPHGEWFYSMKPILVGVLMLAYVYTYNMSRVTKGLRQPREISLEERKALEMLANLRDMDYDKAGNLLERLSPEIRQRIVHHATERLRKEELEKLAWDMVCADLTKSEKEICKLVLDGFSLKDICQRLNKSESNITSQRCHIRKKLDMDRKDDLRGTLEMKIAELRKVM